MQILEETVDADTPDGTMAVLHKRPAGDGTWPKVVIFHDGPGMRASTHEFTAKLAGAGYDVAVPDLYHRHGRMIGFEPADREADPTVGDRVWAMIASLTDDGIQGDLDAALASVDGFASAERLGCVGFCLGARAVAQTMTRLPDRFVAGAMWHPSFLADDEPDSPHLTAGDLRGSLYIGIGDADRVQPIELHQRYFDAVEGNDRVVIDVFPGADHGYTWPVAPSYDENAAATSFERTLALFESTLS